MSNSIFLDDINNLIIYLQSIFFCLFNTDFLSCHCHLLLIDPFFTIAARHISLLFDAVRCCQDPRRVNENAPAPVAHVAEARHVQLDGNLKKIGKKIIRWILNVQYLENFILQLCNNTACKLEENKKDWFGSNYRFLKDRVAKL